MYVSKKSYICVNPYSERVYPEGVIPGRLRWLWNYRGGSADCEIFSGKIREESGDFFIQCLLRSHFIEEERSRKYIIKKKEKERRNIGDEKKFGKNGYAVNKYYVKDDKYERYLKELQDLIENKEEFYKKAENILKQMI